MSLLVCYNALTTGITNDVNVSVVSVILYTNDGNTNVVSALTMLVFPLLVQSIALTTETLTMLVH